MSKALTAVHCVQCGKKLEGISPREYTPILVSDWKFPCTDCGIIIYLDAFRQQQDEVLDECLYICRASEKEKPWWDKSAAPSASEEQPARKYHYKDETADGRSVSGQVCCLTESPCKAHAQSPARNYHCNICVTSFLTMNELLTHMKICPEPPPLALIQHSVRPHVFYIEREGRVLVENGEVFCGTEAEAKAKLESLRGENNG